jgi:Lrp/AsnC family transcriptional regulator, regulator of ectoine-degradation genes
MTKLDAMDVRILAALQKDGRMTYARLSDVVGLSASPCQDRVKRLVAGGLIRRFAAEVEIEQIVETVTVFAQVTLRGHGRGNFERFEAAIRKLPEAVECHKVGGGFDYLVRFVCHDMRAYQEISEELLRAKPGVGQYFSYVVIERVKPFEGVPIERLLRGAGPKRSR